MSPTVSTGSKTLDITIIVAWCIIGAAFLLAVLRCCCSCCGCCASPKNESSNSDSEEMPLDDLESAWPRYPENVLHAESVETLPRYLAADDPPKYTRSVESENG